jgi:hypothetical protein
MSGLSSDEPLAFAALNALSLELHALCHQLPLRAFQTRALELIGTLIPHDSALIAVGTVRGGVPEAHDALLHRQTPELMRSWELVKTEDVVSFITTSSPGKTFAFESAVTYPPGSGIMAHCERFGILQLLTTAVVDARAGSFVVVSLYRAVREHRYTERERATMELVTPHLVASMRMARIDDLRRATHVHLAHAPAAAIINRQGVVLEAVRRRVWPNAAIHCAVCARQNPGVSPTHKSQSSAAGGGLLHEARPRSLPRLSSRGAQ